jgi:uncharacterized protein YndB with AHSA1/START domain
VVRPHAPGRQSTPHTRADAEEAAELCPRRGSWRPARHQGLVEANVALITRTQVINRPVDQVFRVVADAGNFADWNPTIRSSRSLDDQPPGNGSRFEWDLRGFGKVVQEFEEFERNVRVRIVPHIKTLEGGHRFSFTVDGDGTRIDHELEMNPKGIFRVLAPMMGIIGRKNLRDTANALQSFLDREHRS